MCEHTFDFGEQMANTDNVIPDSSLFPFLPQAPSGLARLAAEASHVAHGHNVEFRAMEVRSILNKSVSRRQLSLAWSINPYRGCEFACRYCYARYTHEFLAPRETAEGEQDFRDPNTFERLIFIKEHAAWLLEQELRKIDRTDEIALGTATDPYQPIERTAGITRSLLEVFARKSGYRLGIVTKSKLIERDIDLLIEIARKNTLVLHLTITTPDPALARLLEPRAPRPDLRFSAVRRLREAGLTAGILCSPLLPGITDTAEALDGMAARAAGAHASFFAAEPLFLKSCSRPTFLSFVREHFPHLAADYAARFSDRDFAAQPYRDHLAELVRQACRRHGLRPRSTDALLTRDVGSTRKPVAATRMPQQAALFA
jgi:DNA repair photolyase